jgi:pimeloyl-ACP methyl ester carboxylesterase
LAEKLSLAVRDSLSEVFVMPKAKVNDIRMYYEVKGKGFPLMMINGLGGNMEGWDPRLVEGLSKHFKLVLFDNRGAGRTDLSKGEYTIRLFADDTAGLISALGIPKAHILGISMGGMIAQELAINYPQKVSKLILCSTSSQPSYSKEGSRVLEAMSQSSIEELTKLILSFPFTLDYPQDLLKQNPVVVFGQTSEFVKENPDLAKLLLQRKHPTSQEGFRRQYDAVLGFNTQARLQQIRVPTLVLQGKKDRLVPPESGSILAKAIPNAKLVSFENSAHVLVEEMEEVLKVITEFLL